MRPIYQVKMLNLGDQNFRWRTAEAVEITPEEESKPSKVYKKRLPKPRNFVGLSKPRRRDAQTDSGYTEVGR
jgi:hypothetical protein